MISAASFPASPPWSGPAHRWWALAATCLGLFMALLDVTIVNVALPTIGRDLHAGFSDLQWVINAYTLALAVFLVTVGRIGDIFGRKRMFMVGLGIFTLGSLLCALSDGISVGGLSRTGALLGARALQGIGGSFMLSLSLAIVSATFTGSAIVAFTLSGGFFGLFFFLALYLQNTLGFDALQAGIRFLALSGLIMVGAPLAGRLINRVGPKPLLLVSTALLIVSVLLMSRISTSDFSQTAWLALLPAYLLGGVAVGMANPPISSLAVGTVDRRLAGMASGISGLCRQVGMAVGIAFLGAVLTSRYNTYVHDRILAWKAPGLTPALRERFIEGAQRAGDFAGSAGLRSTGNPYAYMPLFPGLSHIARAAFVGGVVDILRIAAVLLAIGFLASALLVRGADLKQERHDIEPVAAA